MGRSNREIGIKDTIEDFYELQRKQQRGKEGQQQFLLLLKEKSFSSSNLKINSLEMIKLGPIWKRFFTTTLPPLSLDLHCSIFAFVPLFYSFDLTNTSKIVLPLVFKESLFFCQKKLFLNLWNALYFWQ